MGWAPLPAALEGVLYVIYARPVVAGQDSDHVEAQGFEVWLVDGEVLFCEGAKGPLFTWGYGFQGVAEARSAAEFHFYEDEDPFFTDDQVDLPAASPVVALDQPVAAPGQVAQRKVLPPRPGSLLCQIPTPA
jgi:hypothetical protein